MHSSAVFGQSTLKGILLDSLLDKHCAAAVVALLLPDSTLVQFTRSSKDGRFYFKNVTPGEYLLFVSHPSCSPLYKHTDIKAGDARDLGTLALLPRVEVLAAAFVVPRVLPPKMHGDTLEYNTAGIKTRVNATVEELLTHLPGVQVDRNGVITVNGQRIERLLVDGEDLFGADPTFVTRNFNADMIAKVQVLNKKSERAQFTGVDDGQRTATLNLTLKENSKHSYFSKTEAGGSLQRYYNGNGTLGSFNDAQQFVVRGIINNNGNSNSGSDDGGAGLAVDAATNDALGASAGLGIPQVTAGGVHYADHWNANDARAAGNYSYGQMTTHPVSKVINREILPDSVYTQEQESSSSNSKNQHNFDVTLDFNPDSASALRLLLQGNNVRTHGTFMSTGKSAINNILVNSNLRTIHSDAQGWGFQSTVMYNKRIGKTKKNSFSVVTGISKQDNVDKGYVYNQNRFFRPDSTSLSLDTTDQRKQVGANSISLTNDLFYTMPLRKDVVLAGGYGLSYSRNDSYQETYDRGDGKYEQYIDSLSSHYRSDVTIQKATMNLQIHNKSLLFTAIGEVQLYTYKQNDLKVDTALRYQYINFAPRIYGHYSINTSRGFIFDYNGTTQMPSVSQQMPVQNNNDPLHIVTGNPDLRPGFSHNGSITYYLLKSFAVNIGVRFGLTTKVISTKILTDSLGRQVSQAVNVNGNRNVSMRFSFTHTIKPIDLYTHMETQFSYSRNFNYVNQYLCKNENYKFEISSFLVKRVENKYIIRLDYKTAYFYAASSINTSAPLNYWIQNINAQVSIFFAQNSELSTGILYDWRQRLYDFDKNNTSLLWNAQVNRSFFKNKMNVRCQINDILARNTGVRRQINTNQTTESMSNVIGRYWMLVVAWRFTHRDKAH